MGVIGPLEILATLPAVENSLRVLGYRLKGNGVQAACEVLG